MADPALSGTADGEMDPADIEFPHANIVAVEALATVLETAFGPRSHDKLVAEKHEAHETPDRMPEEVEFVVTSDGATILEGVDIEHPMGPIIQRVVGPERPGDTDVEGQDIHDGVCGTVLLTTALLTEAKELLDRGLHPRTVTAGYDTARRLALSELGDARRPLEAVGYPRETAEDVAVTAMTGNDIGQRTRGWARVAVDAVETVGAPTEESFVVRQFAEGTIDDSRLVRGAVLDRNDLVSDEMPSRIEDADVLLLDGQDDGGLRKHDVPEGYQIVHEDGESKRRFADARQARRDDLVERLTAAGVDVVVARQGIESDYYRMLADAGIAGVQAVSKLDLRQIARATGAEPTLVTDQFESATLGRAGVVETRTVEPAARGRPAREIVVFDDCPAPESVAVELHGVWNNVADQATRAVRKAAAAVSDAKGLGDAPAGVVPGAGATETRLARALRTAATSVGGREQFAVDAYADAIDRVTGVLVRNGGHDRIRVLSDLRAAHDAGEEATGFLHPAGELGDATAAGVLDTYAGHRRRYVVATQVANLLLGIDDTVDATFSNDPAGPDEVINPEAAEKQMDALDDQ
ncbi:TCP-1/cpn60 chaperonin family protein [Halorarius halobius]|uniref:TCP-1/cpn60 chaperonin family protein n=1 Tax=Halorarius halobius TaxID=2962671 RepID=UPI0020CB7DEF|nr:TCP-1/cpn60 chaperonin family protein [Halorarius halobius]